MKRITAWHKTLGKSEQRNDDFVMVEKVLHGLTIGVLGDFTSDGPEGMNRRLQQDLSDYLQKAMPTWRERGIAADVIARLLARQVNKLVKSYPDRAKTTLIVLVLDLREGNLYDVCIGDSGLALFGPSGLRYLNRGDTEGIRDAGGFLPHESEQFDIRTTAIEDGDVVFAFTDGFWENSAHFINPDQAETAIAAVLSEPDTETLGASAEAQWFKRFERKDDVTVLVLKADTLPEPDPGSDQFDVAFIEAVVERKLLAFEDDLLSRPGGPAFERELIDLLRNAGPSLETIESRLGAKVDRFISERKKELQNQSDAVLDGVRKSGSAQLQAMARNLEEKKKEIETRLFTLLDQLKAEYQDKVSRLEVDKDQLEAEIRAQTQNLESNLEKRLVKKQGGDETRLIRELRDEVERLNRRVDDLSQQNRKLVEARQSAAGIPLLEEKVEQLERRLKEVAHQTVTPRNENRHAFEENLEPAQLHREQNTSAPRKAGSALQGSTMLWAASLLFIFLAALGFWWFSRNPKVKPDDSIPSTQVQNTPSKPQETRGSKPDPGPSKAEAVNHGEMLPATLAGLTPPVINGESEDRLMGYWMTGRVVMARDLECIEASLNRNREVIASADGPLDISLLPCGMNGRPTLHFSPGLPWSKSYATTAQSRVPMRNLKALWLQIHMNAEQDGFLGSGGQGAFEALSQARRGLLSYWRSKGFKGLESLPDSRLQEVVTAFCIDGLPTPSDITATRPFLKREVEEIAAALLRTSYQNSDQVNVKYRDLELLVVLKENGSPTPIGAWLAEGNDRLPAWESAAPAALFLDFYLGRSKSNGRFDQGFQTLLLAENVKDAELYQNVRKAWGF